MILTFTPPIPPSPGTSNKPEIKILTAEFGDGYTQEAPDGLNHIRRVLTVSWEMLLPAQMNEIIAFFVARGGYDPFWYQPTTELTPVKWTCKEWSDSRADNGFKVNATFRQSFAL